MLIFNPLEWVSGVPDLFFFSGLFLRFGGFGEGVGCGGGCHGEVSKWSENKRAARRVIFNHFGVVPVSGLLVAGVVRCVQWRIVGSDAVVVVPVELARGPPTASVRESGQDSGFR
jgi:hypothetical protein